MHDGCAHIALAWTHPQRQRDGIVAPKVDLLFEPDATIAIQTQGLAMGASHQLHSAELLGAMPIQMISCFPIGVFHQIRSDGGKNELIADSPKDSKVRSEWWRFP